MHSSPESLLLFLRTVVPHYCRTVSLEVSSSSHHHPLWSLQSFQSNFGLGLITCQTAPHPPKTLEAHLRFSHFHQFTPLPAPRYYLVPPLLQSHLLLLPPPAEVPHTHTPRTYLPTSLRPARHHHFPPSPSHFFFCSKEKSHLRVPLLSRLQKDTPLSRAPPPRSVYPHSLIFGTISALSPYHPLPLFR